jgi:hypothetical protein
MLKKADGDSRSGGEKATMSLRHARRPARRSPDRAVSRRRIGLWATLAFAMLTAVGMFVQVYLIAGVLFGEDWLLAPEIVGVHPAGF